MHADPFPPYHPTGPDLWHELRLLRRALNLFIATNHLDSDNKLLIAQQTRKVLLYGDRLAPEPEEQGDPRTDLAARGIPTMAPPACPGYEAVMMADGDPIYFPIKTGTPKRDIPPFDWSASAPEPQGRTVAERVAQLGYQLTCQEYTIHIPRLEEQARGAWRRQFSGEPVHRDGADWYGREDRVWLDPLIHAYLELVQYQAQEPGEGK